MNRMKLLGIILFAISFSQCACVKFDQKPPFTVTNATYTNWVGGVPGVSGTNVVFYYTSKAKITFDSIYFNGRKTKAELKKDAKGTMVVGNFSTSKRNNDLQLHNDPKKEFGNKAPEKADEIPFELKENEAVISFKEGDKIKYYKVENLTKRSAPKIPQAPKN